LELKVNTGGRKNNASKNGRAGRNDRADGTERKDTDAAQRIDSRDNQSNQIRSSQNQIESIISVQREIKSTQFMQIKTVRVNQDSSLIQPKIVNQAWSIKSEQPNRSNQRSHDKSKQSSTIKTNQSVSHQLNSAVIGSRHQANSRQINNMSDNQ